VTRTEPTALPAALAALLQERGNTRIGPQPAGRVKAAALAHAAEYGRDVCDVLTRAYDGTDDDGGFPRAWFALPGLDNGLNLVFSPGPGGGLHPAYWHARRPGTVCDRTFPLADLAGAVRFAAGTR